MARGLAPLAVLAWCVSTPAAERAVTDLDEFEDGADDAALALGVICASELDQHCDCQEGAVWMTYRFANGQSEGVETTWDQVKNGEVASLKINSVYRGIPCSPEWFSGEFVDGSAPKVCYCEPHGDSLTMPTHCSRQNEACECQGTVYYGPSYHGRAEADEMLAKGEYAVAENYDKLPCVGSVFGAEADEEGDHWCFCIARSSEPEIPPARCAGHGEVCACTGDVLYGAEVTPNLPFTMGGSVTQLLRLPHAVVRDVKASMVCTPSNLGQEDPFAGKPWSAMDSLQKACYCRRPSGSLQPDNEPAKPYHCADEGSRCECTGDVYFGQKDGAGTLEEMVRLGYSSKYVEGGIDCGVGASSFDDPRGEQAAMVPGQCFCVPLLD